MNLFEPTPIVDLDPLTTEDSDGQQVSWEFFAPRSKILAEMVELLLQNKSIVEEEIATATSYYAQRRQIREAREAIANLSDSEILEMCPQAAADLGKYKSDAEAAMHWGVQSQANGHSSFKL